MKVQIRRLRRLARKADGVISASISNVLDARDRVLNRDEVFVNGFLCVDGKSFNISVKKTNPEDTLKLFMGSGESDGSWQRVDQVTETGNWIQFFGFLPQDADSFRLKLKLNGLVARVNCADGASKPD